MKKFFAGLCGLVLTLGASALFSTETRVNTLGSISYFLVDNSNVRLYPALIINYPNEIIGEVNRPSVSSFVEVGKYGVFGIGINSDSVPEIVNQAINRAEFLRYPAAPPQFVVYYGKKIKEIPIGLKLNGAKNYYKDSEFNCSQSIRILGSAVGFTYSFAQQTIDFVVGIQRFGFESQKYEAGIGETVTFKDQGKYSFNGGMRFLSLFSPVTLFILGANYDKINVSWKREGYGAKSEILTLKCISGYAGLNFIPSSNTTLIFGLLVSKAEGDTITFPVTSNNIRYEAPKVIVGMETKLIDWFGVRIGANKSFNYLEGTRRIDSETAKEEIIEAPFNLSLGWYINFRSFGLDVMCNELPFVTPSVGLSATYKFSSF